MVIPIRALHRQVKQEVAIFGGALTRAMQEAQALRPKTRAECIDGDRPCPWVSCRYNLYLDVTAAGGLKINFPDRDISEMEDSCALDLADRGGLTLAAVGAAINLNRERIRQVETAILDKLRAGVDRNHG